MASDCVGTPAVVSRRWLARGLSRTQRKCHSVTSLVTALTVDSNINGQPVLVPIESAKAIVEMSFQKKNWCSRAETPPVRPVWRIINT